MTILSIGAPLGHESFATVKRKRLVEFLSPHIRCAMTIQSRLATADTPFLELARAGHLEHPVAFIGDGGRLIQCAERFVGVIESAGMSVSRLRIEASTIAEQTTIEEALARALGLGGEPVGSSLALGLGNPPEVALHVIPLQDSLLSAMWLDARALVIAEPRAEIAPGTAWLRQAFGLTEAEVTVALLVATEPAGLGKVAQTLGISVSTVKTHLQRIFEKTDTHRQADLVRLIVGASREPGCPRLSPKRSVRGYPPSANDRRRARITEAAGASTAAPRGRSADT